LESDSDHPDVETFHELQKLVRHLGDELTSFRRRALQAEARMKAVEGAGGSTKVTPERIERLERENAELRKRLETARSRTRQVLDRVRFLRQQHEGAAT
jgi:predicted  nucleic acid-binding Zn-ribbon protein